MNKEEAIQSILINLSSDLVLPAFAESNKLNPLSGHCYIASEAFCYLCDDKSYEPWSTIHNEVSHWYLKNKNTGEFLDITAKQFDNEVDYKSGRLREFPTKEPGERTQMLLNKIKASNTSV